MISRPLIISSVPGFLGYYVVYAPDDTVTAISVFNTVEGAEESNRRALAWIEKNLGPLLFESVTATAALAKLMGARHLR
jgi:hypothetical protein